MDKPLRSEVFIVTGGGGFVGKALIQRLLKDGAEVRSVSRREYADLTALGVLQFQHDLSSEFPLPDGLLNGVTGIFHTAAHVKMWGAYEEFYRVNVLGTRKLIEAASSCGVERLVYTSSPSVVANGSDLKGVDESQPYPNQFDAFYPQTKAEAEQEVLLSNCEEFFTCALRPHLIFGPGDTNLTTTVLEKAKAGSLKRIGEGRNLVDFTFIDDCVAAHILAMSALKGNPAARGRAYFISQGDPYPLWKWIDKVLEFNGLPPVKKTVSYKTASFLASMLEAFSRTFPFLGEPRLTRFLVNEMYTDHYFNIGAARKYLQYCPSRTVEEALEQTFLGNHSTDYAKSREAA